MIYFPRSSRSLQMQVFQEVKNRKVLQLSEAVIVLKKALKSLAQKTSRTGTRQAICREETLITQVIGVDPKMCVKVLLRCQQILALMTDPKRELVTPAVLSTAPPLGGESGEETTHARWQFAPTAGRTSRPSSR